MQRCSTYSFYVFLMFCFFSSCVSLFLFLVSSLPTTYSLCFSFFVFVLFALLRVHCSKSGDAESVEAARASLGLARGVLQLQSLRQLVGGSLQEFASWKCTLNAKTKS